MLLVQIEIGADEDSALARLQAVLDSGRNRAMTLTWRAPGDDRGAERLFDLREAVPASVNAIVAAAKQAHPDVEKTAGDMVVPFDALAESIDLYRHDVRESRARLCDLGSCLRRQSSPERGAAQLR